MKKFLTSVLCIGMAACLAGCGSLDVISHAMGKVFHKAAETTETAETIEASEKLSEDSTGPVVVPMDESEPTAEDGLFSGENNEPVETPLTEWKIAYISKLDEFRRQLNNPNADIEDYPCEYYLYDIDKDGIPELSVKAGSCEADFHNYFYTYKEGSGLQELEMFYTGHTSLYSYPAGNGLMLYRGHMGEAAVDILSLEDGELHSVNVFEESLNFEQDADDYTNPDQIVPGAKYLGYCAVDRNLFVLQYEAVDAMLTADLAPVTNLGDNGVMQRVNEFMNGSDRVKFYSAETYAVNPGELSYQELLHWVAGYESDYRYDKTVLVDMNRDGYQECVMQLIPEGEYSQSPEWVVFSARNDRLYGYVLHYMDAYELLENGVLRNVNDAAWSQALIFDGDECMCMYVDKGTDYAVVM